MRMDDSLKQLGAMDGLRLIHVRKSLDASFPDHPRSVHCEPVPQFQLKNFYAQPTVFVLASREEGLLSYSAKPSPADFGLPITDRTGGSDLADLPGSRV